MVLDFSKCVTILVKENLGGITMSRQKKLLTILTITAIIYAISNAVIGLLGANIGLLIPFLVVSLACFIFLHGVTRFGIKKLLIIIGIGMAVSLFYEALSIATGFPYSGYHYTDILGPQIMGFPIIVMFGYGVISYTMWTVAESLVSNFNNKLSGANIVLIPILAAFLCTSWDFVGDPIAATIQEAYIWDAPGAYFGVPFSNFLGWLLCTYTMFQLIALVICRQKDREAPSIMKKKTYWYVAIVMYASFFLMVLSLSIFGVNEQITISSGQVFQTMDIYKSMTLIGIIAIVFPAFIAFANVFNSKELE